MSFKLLEIGRAALRRVRIGRAALVAATICASAFTSAYADKTVSENLTLDADTDWSDQGTVTIADGVTIDLNGYALKVAAIDGAGSIVDSLAAAGYKRLEYIASDGQAQYIDTEDSHNASTIVDMRIQFNALTPSYQAFYGARTGGNVSQFGGWVAWTGSQCLFRYGYGGNTASNYSAPVVNMNTIYDVHLEKSGQCTVVTNGVTANTFNIGSGNSDNTTLQLTDFLFAINQDSNNSSTTKRAQWHANAKIYSCVIQKNGGIAHNFIPVKRLSDGKIGMYDSVTGKFHVSGNGKDFVGGSVTAYGLQLAPAGSGAASDFSGLTIGGGVAFSGSLSADLDMSMFASVEIAEGAVLDLAGHNLTVKAVTGAGLITDTVGTALAGSGYERLDYIQATGSQYIDTGYKHDDTTKVDMRISFDTVVVSSWQDFYGARDEGSDKTKNFSVFLHNTSPWFGPEFGKAREDITTHTVTADTIYDIHLEKTGGESTATPEGGDVVSLGTGTIMGNGSLSGHDYLLAMNRYLSSSKVWTAGFHTRAKLYSCKIYSGTTLVRDFVPVKHGNDVGLLDLANGGFYGSATSTKFTAGNPIATTPGGELRIVVADGATASLGDMAQIGGTVKVVKTGAGVLTLPASGHCFAGGMEVASGTLSMTAAPESLAGTSISTLAGGTIEIAATDGASYANDFTIAGGTLKVLASGSGATTTAAIDGTLALETGANGAQPTVFIDTTDCTSPTFQLTTTALTVGSGVTVAPGFVSLSDAVREARIEDGTSIVVEQLSAPVTAEWTGAAEDGNFDNPANWNCSNKNGAALPTTTLPDSSTMTYRLAANADWTAKGAIALGAGVTLDLAGYSLAATSITGDGVILDSEYQLLEYIEATGAQVIDTTHKPDANTKVDAVFTLTGLGDKTIFGTKWGSSGFLAFCSNANDFYALFDSRVTRANGATFSTGTRYRLTVESGDVVIKDDGRDVTLGTASSVNMSGSDLPLSICGVSVETKRMYGYCKIHSFQIWQSGTLLYDFVPARETATGKIGLWNKVEDKMYASASGTPFIAGPLVQGGTPNGELRIAVAENATVSLGDMAEIAGTVKVVKTGAGTLTLPAAGQYFTGGLEVAGGTLAMTQTPGWMTNATVSAVAGAVISIAAGNGASYANNFTLAGGTLKVLASGTGDTTTATIGGTLALALGENDAQPVVSIDMTDCSSTTFQLDTTALTAGTGVTAAPGFVSISNPAYEAGIDGSSILAEQLSTPVAAVWTGGGQTGDFDDPANWTCYNKKGDALPATTLPDGSTLSFRLATDADWTARGAIALGTGVTLDLNGRTLTAASITGDGVVTDTSADNVIVADDGSMYQKILYVQATQDGADNNSGQSKIQYVDTEYYHIGTTKVDIRVEFQDVSYSGNYGYAVFYGCRDQNNYKTSQLGGWFHSGKFYYYDTGEHDGAAAQTGVIYDIRLDKNGSSYANYEDGTLASIGSSNTYGTDYIFANNQVPNGGKYWPCKCRVYSCKVYTGDTPERDFVPVRCVSGTNAGEAGFWCNVTKKFYGNSGYGSLTAGPLAQGETSGGELHITVDENATLSLANTAKIAGNVKIVKDGPGTLVAPTTGQYFVGGIDVTAGTLSMSGALAYGGPINAASGTTVSVPKSVGSAGTSAVSIAGGTLEVANCGTSVVTGTVTLGGNAISVAGSFAPVSGTAAHTITLADGATLDFTQWTGTFPVAYPTLAYASGANITLKLEPATTALTALARSKDAETGKRNGYLFSWDSPPTDVTFSSDAATGARFRVVPDENGLRVSFKAGFSIIIM